MGKALKGSFIPLPPQFFPLQFPGGGKRPHVAPYGLTYRLLKENVAWLSFQPGFSGLLFYFIYKLT